MTESKKKMPIIDTANIVRGCFCKKHTKEPIKVKSKEEVITKKPSQ